MTYTNIPPNAVRIVDTRQNGLVLQDADGNALAKIMYKYKTPFTVPLDIVEIKDTRRGLVAVDKDGNTIKLT